MVALAQTTDALLKTTPTLLLRRELLLIDSTLGGKQLFKPLAGEALGDTQ